MSVETAQSKSKSYLLVGFAFAFGILIGIIISQTLGGYLDRSDEKTSLPQEAPESVANKFILSKKVSASLVWWDQDNGFESIKNNKEKISSINPVWYEVKKNGAIGKYTGAESSEVIKFSQENNIKIIPTINNNCEPADTEKVIKSKGLMSKHIKNIVKLMESNNYDGINIDYECLSGKSIRGTYSDFMRKLSKQIHDKKKLLTTTVHAKSSEFGTWEGPATQDWRVLNQVSDQIKIMVYDYHWATSEAGDIAPISWVEEILSYAKNSLDPNKTYLGIHFYGYDWKEKQAKDLTHNDVLELIERYNPKVKTSKEEEKYFTYKNGGDTHKVYFSDSTVVSGRVKLVQKYEIAGIGIWRLGQEDPKSWDVIEKLLK